MKKFRTLTTIYVFRYVVISLLLGAQSCNNYSFEESPAPQPYQYIKASSVGEKVSLSPDKIVDWQWENPKADDELEIYTMKPVLVKTDTPKSFDKISTLTKKSSQVVVKGTGSIMMDFIQNAGAIFTQEPYACCQTMTIDVKLAQQNEYEFSLCFLDWDSQLRRTAIEMIDIDTKNIIAPVRIVSKYSGGKYMKYRYNNSVRFRINHVRGPNAVVSGIFFDKAN